VTKSLCGQVKTISILLGLEFSQSQHAEFQTSLLNDVNGDPISRRGSSQVISVQADWPKFDDTVILGAMKTT